MDGSRWLYFGASLLVCNFAFFALGVFFSFSLFFFFFDLAIDYMGLASSFMGTRSAGIWPWEWETTKTSCTLLVIRFYYAGQVVDG